MLSVQCNKNNKYQNERHVAAKPLSSVGIRIRMFLGLLDPDPDPLVRGTDPDQKPDPSLFSHKCVAK
jgi:hypothetical protein